MHDVLTMTAMITFAYAIVALAVYFITQSTAMFVLAGHAMAFGAMCISMSLTMLAHGIMGLFSFGYRKVKSKPFFQGAHKQEMPAIMHAVFTQAESVPAVIRKVDFGKRAVLTCWFYPDRVVRVMRIRNEAIRKVCGTNRVELSTLTVVDGSDSNNVLNASRTEALSLLESYLPSKMKKGVEKTDSSRSQAASTDKPIKADALFTFNAQKQEDDAASLASSEAFVSPVPPIYSAHKKPRVLMKYVGTLKSHGMRKHPPRTAGEEPYNCYTVELETEEGIVSVQGTDISRAITEAKADVGDMVEITKHGRTEIKVPAEINEAGAVLKPEKSNWKNLFSCLVLEKHQRSA